MIVRLSTLALLVIFGHAQAAFADKVKLVVHSDPAGATVYANSSEQMIGYAPVVLEYNFPRNFFKHARCDQMQPLVVRWVSGVEVRLDTLRLCGGDGKTQQITVRRPTWTPPDLTALAREVGAAPVNDSSATLTAREWLDAAIFVGHESDPAMATLRREWLEEQARRQRTATPMTDADVAAGNWPWITPAERARVARERMSYEAARLQVDVAFAAEMQRLNAYDARTDALERAARWQWLTELQRSNRAQQDALAASLRAQQAQLAESLRWTQNRVADYFQNVDRTVRCTSTRYGTTIYTTCR